LGLKVERRNIDFDKEIGTWSEVGAVGTAVVITPVESLQKGDKVHAFNKANVLQKLHDRLLDIQRGDSPDVHGFMRDLKLT